MPPLDGILPVEIPSDRLLKFLVEVLLIDLLENGYRGDILTYNNSIDVR